MIRISPSLRGFDPARMVHIAGALVVVSGLCFWGIKLFVSPNAVEQKAMIDAPITDPTGDAVAAWLGPGDVRLNVAVLGLARRNDRAVALLSINDAAPQSYMVGESLMPDVTLRAVEVDGVVLDRAGRAIRIAVPARPQPPVDGIVRKVQ